MHGQEPSIKFGCETYTWQMPGEQYKGRLEHIMGICRQAGFKGIEPETSFLRHLEDPMLLAEALDEHELELPVLCVVEDWRYPHETAAERARADQWISLLDNFPDTILLLVQMPGADRRDLKERQRNLLLCVNAFARRATDAGITCSYHPNSPSGSIFRTDSDYEILLGGLDEQIIGYCPDIGHIARGGMDPLEVLQQYRSQINLVHYKDMYADGRWAPTGQGDIDMKAITSYLVETAYAGWIIMEDECDEAITDPDAVTLEDGRYVEQVLRPIVQAN